MKDEVMEKKDVFVCLFTVLGTELCLVHASQELYRKDAAQSVSSVRLVALTPTSWGNRDECVR